MTPPNLVLVFPDQMRGQAMGFVGQEPVRTPNLDRFAAQGLVLPHAVANYPVCSPCRAMMMSGLYAHSNRVIENCTSNSAPYGVELPADAACWSDVLRAHGYSLGYIGKWHLDAPHEPYIDCSNNRGAVKWNEWCPPHRRHGFDYWYAYGTYDRHTRPMYWRTGAAREEFRYVDQWGPEHEADRAVAYLRNEGHAYRDPDKPFALVVAMNPPHMPYDLVPERYVEAYRDLDTEALCRRPNIPPAGTRWGDYYRAHIRHYYAMISGVDEQFGRIVDALHAQGLDENTIVVFTSDHGNCLGIHDRISKNNPYEESMRVPLIVRWPGQIAPRQDDLLWSAPDLAPTLLELMGLGDAIPPATEGRSYARLFTGQRMARPRSQLYLWTSCAQPALGRRGVRTHQYTYVVTRAPARPPEFVLYDNVNDPYQLQNIFDSQPVLARQLATDLRHELRQWLQATGDPWLDGVQWSGREQDGDE